VARRRTSEAEALSEAVWWVQRWVSGSMRDPDWEEGHLEHVKDVETAFALVQNAFGPPKSARAPLWRYLAVSQAEADAILATRTLPPHTATFQSFTTSARLAAEIGAELDRPGVPLLVCAEPEPGDVMYALADLMASKSGVAGDLMCLEDWAHQDEVVVRVAAPLPLLEARVVDWDVELAEGAGLAP